MSAPSGSVQYRFDFSWNPYLHLFFSPFNFCRFAGPPGVGPTPFIPGRGGDFGGDLFPSGGGMGGGGGLPGPGGLLGPGHPMFGGGSG